MKKILALVLAMLMVAGMVSAFASGNNDTITITSAKPGETYKIYKLFDLVVDSDTAPSAYSYTVATEWRSFFAPADDTITPATPAGAGNQYITVNAAGYVTAISDVAALAQAAAGALNGKTEAATAVTVAADANPAVAAFNSLADGYYLITSTAGTIAMTETTPDASAVTIREKNPDNTSSKEVQEAAERNGAQASWGSSNDAAVGDTVTYRSTVNIVKGTRNVVYNDTMSNGLTWDGASATKVYTDVDCTTELNSSYYTVAEGTNGKTFTVSFSDENYVAGLTANVTVYIKYTAKLNDNAVVTTPETNEQYLTWGNGSESTHTTVTTNTHKFFIKKYAAGIDVLAGAKFQLFTTQTGTTPIALLKSTDGYTYRIYDGSNPIPEGYTVVTDSKIETLATTQITVEGVDSDDYWLEETDAPEGYNRLTDRQKVEVNAANNTVAEVLNQSGSELPSTGGIGTTIFYVGGGLLVLLAVVLLVTKRRMKAED